MCKSPWMDPMPHGSWLPCRTRVGVYAAMRLVFMPQLTIRIIAAGAYGSLLLRCCPCLLQRQASSPMMKQQDMKRVEVARDRIGLTRKALAKAMGVSITSLDNWADGIPSKRVPALAEILQVPEEWITAGRNPPHWFIMQALKSGRGEIDWSSLPEKTIQDAWWDVLEGALLRKFLEDSEELQFPNRIRIQRWRVIGRIRDSILSQFDSRQIKKLARDLSVWPPDLHVQSAIQVSFPTKIIIKEGDSSCNPSDWLALMHRLESGARGYHAARNDRSRQMQRQNEVWNLLMEPQPGELLLAGPAIVPILEQCIRIARSTDIIFGMSAQLETAVEMSLVNEFQGRSFSIQDIGRSLEHARGIRLIGRGRASPAERRRRALERETVSEDSLLRILIKIMNAKILPLESRGRKWVMGKMPPRSPHPLPGRVIL